MFRPGIFYTKKSCSFLSAGCSQCLWETAHHFAILSGWNFVSDKTKRNPSNEKEQEVNFCDVYPRYDLCPRRRPRQPQLLDDTLLFAIVSSNAFQLPKKVT
jgi:hypothetical protein